MRPSTLEERFRAGDEAALPQVYRRYAGAMHATAYHLLGKHDLAADAVQQAFIQAWRAAATFDPGRGLQPWLYSITRRAAIDTYRRRRHEARTVSYDGSWSAEAEAAVEGPSMDSAWQAWQVRRALDRLHSDERRVLRLAYYEGLTQSEIAAVLGIAIGTVKSRTARAQRRLGELLAHLRDPAVEEPRDGNVIREPADAAGGTVARLGRSPGRDPARLGRRAEA
jgi:RNA polymerase sigma-70 factor (ECF subfamily)